MNKFAKIFLGIIGVIALAFAAIFYFTAGMVGAADEFFVAVKDKEIDTAYSYLSDDFKASTSQSELIAFMEKNQLDNFQEANWQSRSINGGRGDLVGSITTSTGGVVPITVSFVKGQDGWKIYAIRKPSSGLQVESPDLQLPSEEEQVQLVRGSMHAFAVSVNEGSMAKFHGHTSNLWQQQFSIDDLDQAFGAFYELGADLTVLDNYSPRFDSIASFDEDGFLLIAGHYPTKPNQLQFEQKYIFEGLGWKLAGFSANIK